MILGLDIRSSTCGWSLLDEASSSFVGLGVHTLGRAERLTTLSRARRSHGLAHVLAERAPGCSTIVVERWIPGAVSGVDIGLAWGSVLGVAQMLTPPPRLLTVEPHRWQAEVLLGRTGATDEQAYANAEYLLRSHPRAEAALRRLPRDSREPAIAASMIALCGVLRGAKSRRAEAG